ncbi:MAG: tRNA adenosine(34) deaminase TadA [Gammaproteobacteria bacterium]
MTAAADARFMSEALTLAEAAGRAGEVSVGAVLVLNSEILGRGANAPIGRNDPTAHAEILALREAGERCQNYRLLGATLYATLEPCPMCAAALVHARIDRLVYAAADPKTGAAGSIMNLVQDARLNHRMTVEGGVLATEASALLQSFFLARRKAGG